MALSLSKTGIEQNQTINAWHVTQSIDAFAGTVAYDITLSGSLELTGSVSSLNGFTGDLTGDVTGTATNANNAKVANLPVNNIDYRLTFVSPTGLPDPSGTGYSQLVVDSGSDGSGIFYNPSTNTLNAGIFSGSNDGSQVDFVGSASYALNAGAFEEYITGSYNYTTIYPQGTIYSKFEDTYASQSATDEYDLLSATTRFTGDRNLPTPYTQQGTLTDAKIVKFGIKGHCAGNAVGASNAQLDSYVKIGETIITGTQQGQAGAITLNSIDDVPFEIEYEIIFSNDQIYGCGFIGWCKGEDYKRYTLSDLYSGIPKTAINGDLKFIVSGSSDINITGSAAYVEFIN
jgi:hypothetical protein